MSMHAAVTARSDVAGPYPAYRGLRYEEDKALEEHLSGLTVPKANGFPQAVKVFFRDPEREIDATVYPYIMIDALPISFRRNEEHRGWVPFTYEAYTGNALPHQGMGWFPIPIMINYQITVACRNLQHDIMINDILATSLLPFRFGGLYCPSGTVRRLDVNSGPMPADLINGHKQRVFRKIWTIAVSAELTDYITQTELVADVGLTVTQITAGSEVPAPDLTEI